MNLKIRFLIVLSLTILFEDSAFAKNQLILTPGVMYFDYEERDDDGSFLDGETGGVPGISAALKHHHEFGLTGILFGGFYTGTVKYDGHTNFGMPIKTRTQADFFTFGVAAEVPLNIGFANSLLNIGYRFKRWERDIQPVGTVSGLFEVYRWQEFFLSLDVIVNKLNSRQWSISAGIFHTLNADIEVDLVPLGYGKPRMALGTDLGFEGSIKFLEISDNLDEAGFKLSYKTWKFGRSANEVSSGVAGTTNVFEPNSESHIILFEIIREISF